MGHYDSAYEFDEKYGRDGHQTELQKANRRILELEKQLNKESKMDVDHGGVPINQPVAWPFPTGNPVGGRSVDSYEKEIGLLKGKIDELHDTIEGLRNLPKDAIVFNVDGHKKYFKLEECVGDLDIVEITEQGHDVQRIAGISEQGKLIRYEWVSGDGWKLGKNSRLKVDKVVC